eukprot:scaffold92105_cov72-Phaeocystis_antarctica.AAC.4
MMSSASSASSVPESLSTQPPVVPLLCPLLAPVVLALWPASLGPCRPGAAVDGPRVVERLQRRLGLGERPFGPERGCVLQLTRVHPSPDLVVAAGLSGGRRAADGDEQHAPLHRLTSSATQSVVRTHSERSLLTRFAHRCTAWGVQQADGPAQPARAANHNPAPRRCQAHTPMHVRRRRPRAPWLAAWTLPDRYQAVRLP